MKALFDTNVLIDYLNGIEGAKEEFDRHTDRLISVITWMEVLVGAKTDEEADVIEMFLREFTLVGMARDTARAAVALRQSRRLRLPDAIIWASARAESALLVTRNTKDFPPHEPGVRVPPYAA